MITLNFLHDNNDETQVYVLEQEKRSDPFKVFFNGKMIAEIDQVKNKWTQLSEKKIDHILLAQIGKFISNQNYQKLPGEIKAHWNNFVEEALATADDFYLIITKPEIDFDRFEKTFKNYIANLVKDEWQITFRVCDACFNNEFIVKVND
nr:hypothetical protein [Pedobacter sp. ASV2]